MYFKYIYRTSTRCGFFFGKILRNSKRFFKVSIHTVSHSKCYIADVLVAKSKSESRHLKDLLNVERIEHKVLYKINAFLCGLYLRFYDSYLPNLRVWVDKLNIIHILMHPHFNNDSCQDIISKEGSYNSLYILLNTCECFITEIL